MDLANNHSKALISRSLKILPMRPSLINLRKYRVYVIDTWHVHGLKNQAIAGTWRVMNRVIRLIGTQSMKSSDTTIRNDNKANEA